MLPPVIHPSTGGSQSGACCLLIGLRFVSGTSDEACLLCVLQDSVIIGSRLDTSQDAPTCRLAFYGRILKLIDPASPAALQQLKIYKLKQKQGSIDRVSPDNLSAVCKGMFKKETDISLFAAMKVGNAATQHHNVVLVIHSLLAQPKSARKVVDVLRNALFELLEVFFLLGSLMS